MKFDPLTKSLYTDAGEFIKTLGCPLARRWEQLAASDGGPHRRCDACERAVLDTAGFDDAELLVLVRADPETCLSVSARQGNVTLCAAAPGSTPPSTSSPARRTAP